jgi:hypothetical protein
MTALLLLLPVLSALTLAAHFLRNGHLLLSAAAVAFPILLVALRRRWVVRYGQLLLAVGTLEWSRAAGALLHERLAQGLPYVRMLVILYGVAAVTAASLVLLRATPIRRRYGFASPPFTGPDEARIPGSQG